MEKEFLKQVVFAYLASNLIVAVLAQAQKPQGALVSTDYDGMVGFSLDNLPSYSLDAFCCYIMNNVTENDWQKRAEMQLFHTVYRQVFRINYFEGKLQLTLPPENLWEFTFTSRPYQKSFQGHLHMVRNYTFHSVVIGTASTINASEPLLKPIGGVFTDIFMVPVDPEHVFQRSGYACADEAGFSLDTVNSENYLTYFDQECEVEPYTPIQNRTYGQSLASCHWTSFPNVTCLESLENDVGYINLSISWKRLQWNDTIANQYRYGEMTSDTPDLVGVTSKLIDEINVGYKYIDENSCTLEEGSSSLGVKGCVGAAGWRQLLRFTSSSINAGKSDLHLGEVRTDLYLSRGVYEYDPCHLHYHFQHYENYLFGNVRGRKTGFCIQTTWRYYNNEYVPFNTPYEFCDYQGITPGWGDDYYQGLDCQWIDVTGLESGDYDLNIIINPDKFICEGTPNLSPNGSLQWIPTNFTSNNKTVYREDCNLSANYSINNLESITYTLLGNNSLVTLPCKRSATLSPLKDCGFEVQHDNLTCSPNRDVTIDLQNQDSVSAVVRICETSKQLGHSTQCEYVQSLSNKVIQANSKATFKFKCPSARSSFEPGGLYSILVSPLVPIDPMPSVKLAPKSNFTIFQMFREFLSLILGFIRMIFG